MNRQSITFSLTVLLILYHYVSTLLSAINAQKIGVHQLMYNKYKQEVFHAFLVGTVAIWLDCFICNVKSTGLSLPKGCYCIRIWSKYLMHKCICSVR